MITTRRGDYGKTYIEGGFIVKEGQHVELMGWLDECEARLAHVEVEAGVRLELVHDVVRRCMESLVAGHIIPEAWRRNAIRQMEEVIAQAEGIKMKWARAKTELGCRLDLLRTAIRHAERCAWKAGKEEYGPLLNRLGDYAFAHVALAEAGKWPE